MHNDIPTGAMDWEDYAAIHFGKVLLILPEVMELDEAEYNYFSQFSGE